MEKNDWIRYEYIRLLPEFVREVLDAYENWNGKDGVPMKLQELMMVLQIEVTDVYQRHPKQNKSRP